MCSNCIGHGLQCVYDREPDTTPITELRRRHDELVAQNAQLMELYNTLRTRPEADAQEILRRIRATDDLDQALQLIRAGVTLAGIRGPQQGAEQSVSQPRRPGNSQCSRSHPWTNVAAADDGLVQELIDLFLSDDHPYFLAFIEKECFLSDFHYGNRHGVKYCSQLLVNAICAVSCVRSSPKTFYQSAPAEKSQFASNTVKVLDVNQNKPLRERFYGEAERLLDLPRDDGAASLPTIQAFYLMILYESSFGRDRTTLTARCRSFATVKRQPIDSHYFPGGNMPTLAVSRDQRAISTIVWSSFCAQR